MVFFTWVCGKVDYRKKFIWFNKIEIIWNFDFCILGQRQRNQRPQQPQPQAQQQQQQQQPQQQPQNLNQVFAQLMAHNARLQFPPAVPPPTITPNSSTGKISKFCSILFYISVNVYFLVKRKSFEVRLCPASVDHVISNIFTLSKLFTKESLMFWIVLKLDHLLITVFICNLRS